MKNEQVEGHTTWYPGKWEGPEPVEDWLIEEGDHPQVMTARLVTMYFWHQTDADTNLIGWKYTLDREGLVPCKGREGECIPNV